MALADQLATLSDVQRRQLRSLLLDFDRAWCPDALTRQLRELPSDDANFLPVALSELVRIDLRRH